MIKFKVNGKPVSIASSWDDLTMKQFLALSKPGNDTHAVLSILTGIDVDTFKKATIIGLEDVLIALNFSNTPAKFDVLPEKIGPFKLPINHKGQFNIQFESLGQFEDMRSDMKGVENTLQLSERYPKFCARYLQKIRDGEYNPEKAEQMVEQVLEMPAKEVIVVGSFFYLKLMSLLNGTPSSSQSTPQNPKKSKPGSKSSNSNLGSTRPSITSRRKSMSRKK